MTSRTEGHEAPLDSAALARFHRLAPEVLRRRDGTYFARELAFGLQFLVIGAVPIVGTARFGWGALSWLAYVVIGAWLGIVTDTLALVFLGECLLGQGRTPEARALLRHSLIVLEASRGTGSPLTRRAQAAWARADA